METIDTASLRVFVEVVRRSSVTAAGAALNQTKSSVSKVLTQLERRIGVRLLERSSRRVAVTPAGALLARRAESILLEMERTVDEVRQQTRAVRGTLHVASPPELCTLLAETFFPRFLQLHPQLALNVAVGYSFEDLRDPAFDVAFRLGSVHDEGLVAYRLGTFRRILIASPAYLEASPVRTLDDLAQRNCLVFSSHENAATWTFEPTAVRAPTSEATRDVPVRGNLAVHSFASLLQAAATGSGVTRVPEFAAKHLLASGRVVRLLPEWSAPPTEVFVVHRFGHNRLSRVAALVSAARNSIEALIGAHNDV